MSETSYKSHPGRPAGWQPRLYDEGGQDAQAGSTTYGPAGQSTPAPSGADQGFLPESDGHNGQSMLNGRVGPTSPTSSADPAAAGDTLVSDGDSFRSRWSSVQVGFVGESRCAVDETEQLVTDVMTDLVDGFRAQSERIGGDQGASTDEMRVAFQRYRDFFDRLLNALTEDSLLV